MDLADVALWLRIGLVAVFAIATIVAVSAAIIMRRGGFEIDTLWGGLGGGSGGLRISPALAFALVALAMAGAAVASLPPLPAKDSAAGKAADAKPPVATPPSTPAPAAVPAPAKTQ